MHLFVKYALKIWVYYRNKRKLGKKQLELGIRINRYSSSMIRTKVKIILENLPDSVIQ